MPTHARTISNKSKTRPTWKPHLAKEKVKEIENEDVLPAVEREKKEAKARTGVAHGSDNHPGSDALIPLVAKAVKRLQTLARSAMHIVGANARIVTRIAIAAMLHLTKTIVPSVTHTRRNAIVKARCHMPCLHRISEALN